MRRALIVRLGALGDIVHALPAVSALRTAWPDARLDWVVDRRHRELVDLVPIVDRRIVLDGRGGVRQVLAAIRELREIRYDVAVDFQGLLKSAVIARASGARRVVGFGLFHLRERGARPFYTEVAAPGAPGHVIRKNLALVAALGANSADLVFPIEPRRSTVPAALRARLGDEHASFALLNPGAAWPNKRWPVDRFGALAREIAARQQGLRSAVAWGPGEEGLADAVVSSSGGSAVAVPPTTIADLIALVDAARVVVAGDTGPLHLAAARGTPVVGIYGPTDPARNGPWSTDDLCVSRSSRCGCHHKRRCRMREWCLDDVEVAEVAEAVDRRLSRSRR
jgi:lipopolysaccharide heptosyltransferase I